MFLKYCHKFYKLIFLTKKYAYKFNIYLVKRSKKMDSITTSILTALT